MYMASQLIVLGRMNVNSTLGNGCRFPTLVSAMPACASWLLSPAELEPLT
jgi:hypothetical protein